MIETLTRIGKQVIPKGLFQTAQPLYHKLLSWFGAFVYRHPSRHIRIVGVTGTKGKTTVVELINAILEEEGLTTALSSTLRFKIADRTERNLYKMTMPGRFFLQKFLRQAVDDKCDSVVLEMTSEGVKQFRHAYVELDALVFTNISPEHVESHGSYEAYRQAKKELVLRLARSKKDRRVLVVNKDDSEAPFFLDADVPEKYTFSLKDAEPYEVKKRGVSLTLENTEITSPLSGTFNIYNILASAAFASTQDIDIDTIKRAVEKCTGVRGRVEFIEEGQSFNAVVDYAHTPDSLEKFYGVFKDTKNICVIGNTGGGRDTWKRPEMARIAEANCKKIIFTNEDPYDENPQKIIDDMIAGLSTKNYEIIIDRRLAIRKALSEAKKGWSVLITGKGTDPYIMGPGGSKTAWDDASVVREELERLLKEKK